MLEKLDTKEVSSRDLSTRISSASKAIFRINSIVHRFCDARTAADESDQRRAKSKSRKKRPLEGLPFTLKNRSHAHTPVSPGTHWRHRRCDVAVVARSRAQAVSYWQDKRLTDVVFS